MYASATWLLVIFSITTINANNPNNKCLSLLDENVVDYWVILTTPGSRDFYYADSRNPDISLQKNMDIEDFFARHTRETAASLQAGSIKTLPGWNPLEAVLQIWFNDQPYGITKEELARQHKAPLAVKLSDVAATDFYEFRFKAAHAKGMISMKGKDKSGFYINHSFPKLPADLIGEPDSIKNGKNEAPYIFRWIKDGYKYFKKPKKGEKKPLSRSTPEASTFKYSQHALCFNFVNSFNAKSEFLDLIDFAHYQSVSWNFHPMYWGTKNDQQKLLAILGGESWTKTIRPIIEHWQTVTKTKDHPLRPPRHKKGEPQNPVPNLLSLHIDQCTWTKTSKILDLGSSAKLTIVAHAPFPIEYKFKKNSPTEKQEHPWTSFHLVGPVHWLQVSKIFETEMLLSTWEEPSDEVNGQKASTLSAMPAVILDKAAIYPVSEVKYFTSDESTDVKSWSHNQMHEKIGVSTVAENPVVCFADANHRTSEQTHAGLTFCLKNDKIWKFFHQAVLHIEKVIETTKYATKPLPIKEKASTSFTANWSLPVTITPQEKTPSTSFTANWSLPVTITPQEKTPSTLGAKVGGSKVQTRSQKRKLAEMQANSENGTSDTAPPTPKKLRLADRQDNPEDDDD